MENNYHNEPDELLLELIAMKEEFPVEAKNAYSEFYTRYWEIMYAVALKVCKYKSDHDQEAKDLLQETFMKVYFGAHTYKTIKSKDSKKVRYYICAWITKIMKNVFLDLNPVAEASEYQLEDEHLITSLKFQKHFEDPDNEFWDDSEKIDTDEIAVETNPEQIANSNVDIIIKHIQSFSERDRDILTTYYLHYIPGKYTPHEVLDYLQKKYNTTRVNIRKILQKC